MSDGSVYMLDEPWLELLADRVQLLLLLMMMMMPKLFPPPPEPETFWGVFVLFPK